MTPYEQAQLYLGLNVILNLFGTVAMWRVARDVVGPGYWATASAMIFVGTAASGLGAAIGLRQLQSLENVLDVAAMWWGYFGIRRFYGLSIRPLPVVIGLSIYFAIDLGARLIAYNPYRHMIVLSVMLLVPMVLAVATLVGNERRRSAAWMVATFFMGALAITFAVRTLWAVAMLDPSGSDFQPGGVIALPAIVAAVCITGAYVGLILLTAERLIEERRAREQEAQVLARRFEELAITDALTGVHNRRSFLDDLRGEIGRARREGAQFAVLMIDLDHFKVVNDQHGHAAGDDALRRTVAAVKPLLRGYDRIGRIGGEEFVVVLANVDRAQALAIADRIRAAIAAIQFDWHGRAVTLSASLGVVLGPIGESDDHRAVDRLLDLADKAMYLAKSNGRNRVELAPV